MLRTEFYQRLTALESPVIDFELTLVMDTDFAVRTVSEQQITISDLPPELVDAIFRYGCISSTAFCIALSRTSIWTRRLALPYLYSTVVITKLASSTAFSQALSHVPIHPPQPEFDPSRHVKSLWITAVSNRVLAIFRSCDNLVNLALDYDNFFWLVHASSLAHIRASFLSPQSITRKSDLHLVVVKAKTPHWSLAHFIDSNPSLTSPLFNKITHLQIGSIGSYSSHLNLAHFCRLTHIAVPYHHPEDQSLNDLLSVFNFAATSFLVVVLMIDALSKAQYQDAIAWIATTHVSNPKVYGIQSRLHGMQAEWEEEVRGGLSIWDRAEIFTQTLQS